MKHPAEFFRRFSYNPLRNGTLMNPLPSFFYLGSSRSFLFSNSSFIGHHQHYHLEILVSLFNKIKIEASSKVLEGHFLLIKPNFKHPISFHCKSPFISILLDPKSSFSRKLSWTFLKENPLHFLPLAQNQPFFNKLKGISHPADKNTISSIYQDFMEITQNSLLTPPPIDQRIQQCFAYLNENLEESASANQIAKRIFLSENRFLHLFKEQTGIPFRRYVLWQRLRRATKYVFRGYSFTDAALSAGFSDSSHLSRVYKQLLGMNPRNLFKNKKLRFILVLED